MNLKNKGLFITLICVSGTLAIALAVVLTMLIMGANKGTDRATGISDTATSTDAVASDNQTDLATTEGSGMSGSNGSIEVLQGTAIRDKQVQLKGNGNDTVTILMYVNGSNLESDDQEATTDLSEAVAAGSNDKVKVVVQTMGTKKWASTFGISNTHTQRYLLDGNGMTLVDDSLGQLDCTDPKTLADFIKWGVTNYPADRYILQFWDHGGGPVYGFGYDEYNSDENACLSLDEIQQGLKAAGVYFDFIGMDCCIMSCLEVAVACYDYCDYMILAEDFESGLGWSYTGFMSALYANTSISTYDLAKIAIDDYVKANESDSEWGDDGILALIDESKVKVLYKAWTDFASENIDALLNQNFSTGLIRKKGGRLLPSLNKHSKGPYDDNWYGGYYDSDSDDPSMADYFIVDIMAAAASMSTNSAKVLESAVANTLLYVNATSGDSTLTGIAVSLPYGDSSFYAKLKTVLTNCGIDSEYINLLGQFVNADGLSDYYDYSDFDDNWNGWDNYYDDYDWNDYDYNDDYDCNWDDFDYEDSYNDWYDDNYDCDDYYDYDDYDDYGEYYDDYYYDDYYYDDYYYDDWWY